MKIEANVWQKVPGTSAVEFFPTITKPSIISLNCYIFAGPDAIMIIDLGASMMATQNSSFGFPRSILHNYSCDMSQPL